MKVLVLLSGKRKSGKDYVAERLKTDFQSKFDFSVSIVRLSEPLKREYSVLKNLNFDDLMTSDEYKEKFRHEMVRWGEEIRQLDSGHFCRLALDQCPEARNCDVCIVADCRRPSDLQFFQEFSLKNRVILYKIRIVADVFSRVRRGWKFSAGVDDGETECALDDEKIEWNFVLNNNKFNKNKFDKDMSDLTLSVASLVRKKSKI